MTVEDAIQIAKTEYSKKKTKTKVVTEPVWFDKKIESEQANEEEKQNIEELLKEFR